MEPIQRKAVRSAAPVPGGRSALVRTASRPAHGPRFERKPGR